MSVIRIATTQAELEAVYRFRYEIGVNELQRSCPHIDHRAGQLRHPLDETAVNFAAFDGSTVIGAVRQNYGRAARFGALASFYSIADSAAAAGAGLTITTGLMVTARERGGMTGSRLACAAYEHALTRDIRWGYIDCIAALEPLFRRLGYIDHLPEAPHPEYGFPVRRLKLNLLDIEHLERVRSPFLELLRAYRRLSGPTMSFSSLEVS